MQFDFIEEKVLGINHAELGAAVLEKWGFPMDLVQVIRYHHHPDNAEEFQNMIDIVHVADIISSSGGFGCGRDGLQYELSSKSMKRLGLNENKMDIILFDTLDETNRFEEVMEAM